MTKDILTQDRLKYLFEYNPDDGIFTRRVAVSRRFSQGYIAGSLNKNGYIYLMVDGFNYKAHRLAWLYIYGEHPKFNIDHKNGIKNDNRILNLRQATHSDNLKNVGVRKDNKLGVKGIHVDKKSNKYIAQLIINGKQKKIGRFNTLEEAKIAYKEAAKINYGEFFHN